MTDKLFHNDDEFESPDIVEYHQGLENIRIRFKNELKDSTHDKILKESEKYFNG